MLSIFTLPRAALVFLFSVQFAFLQLAQPAFSQTSNAPCGVADYMFWQEATVETVKPCLATAAKITPESRNAAIEYAPIEVVSILIDGGLDINRPAFGNETALHKAVGWDLIPGRSEMVRLLLEQGAVVDVNDIELLNKAASQDNGMLPLLIEAGMDPNILTENGAPLIRSAILGNSFRNVSYLLSKGADARWRSAKGDSLLNRGYISYNMAKILLVNGASPIARNSRGYTPLHSVIFPETAKLLIESGADVNARTKDGITPLHIVTENLNVVLGSGTPSRSLFAEIDERVELFRYLINQGADINARVHKLAGEKYYTYERYSGTPLLSAIYMLIQYGGSVEEVKKITDLFVEHGANPHTMGPFNGSLLHSFVTFSDNCQNIKCDSAWRIEFEFEDGNNNHKIHFERAIEIQTGLGTDISSANENGQTIVHLAARFLGPTVVTFLADAGVDLSIKDSAGKTAADYARENPYLEGTPIYWRLNDASY